MVNLDAKHLRFMSTEEFRVLTAVEMGMKNHEIVPAPLVESLSGLRRGGTHKMLRTLTKVKLVAHQSIPYEGFRLTAKGYDYLALKALARRGVVSALGIQIGVGKESDIFTIMHTDGREVCLKLHRLGRTCFRTVKNNRDYIRQDQHASWIYLSRLSALKEYAFMKALHTHGFPTPEPIDVNRHCVIMSLARGYQLNSIQELRHPGKVFDQLMQIIVRLAEHGLIHCDFNEFNLLVDDDEMVTVIDFPQMVSTSHVNAQWYFDRDVNCVATFFKRRFGFCAAALPSLVDDVSGAATVNLDVELAASGWTKEMDKDLDKLMETMAEEEARAAAAKAAGGAGAGEGGGEEDEDDDEDEEDDDEDEDEVGDGAVVSAAQYAPFGNRNAPFGNRNAPVHAGQGDAAALAAAADAAEAAIAAEAAAEAAEKVARARAAAPKASAQATGADSSETPWTELDGLGMDALARLAMSAVTSANRAVTSACAPEGNSAAAAAAAAASPPELSLPAPPALPTPRAARDGSDEGGDEGGEGGGECDEDGDGEDEEEELPNMDEEAETRSVAESARTTTSTASARFRPRPTDGGPSARAAEARERVKAELKKGRPSARGSRNELKDREKRKVMSGMKKDMSGASAHGW